MKKDIRDYKRNGKVFAYILDSINIEDENVICETDKDKIIFFFDTFCKEFNFAYNKQRYPNLQVRISEYLRGLPSCICLPFYRNDIINTLQSLGVNTEKDPNRIEDNFYNVVSFRLIQIAKYYNLQLSLIY